LMFATTFEGTTASKKKTQKIEECRVVNELNINNHLA